MIPFIDSHAHLSMLRTKAGAIQQHFDEWAAMGLTTIVDVGTEANDLAERIAGISRTCDTRSVPRIVFSAGIWPSDRAIRNRQRYIDELENQIKHASRDRLVAIGECGIDRYWNRPDQGADTAGERELLAAQLELAQRYTLPVIIHSRDGAPETLEVLKDFPSVCGIIHCFSYGKAELKAFLDLGWYVSFAGNVTFKNAHNLREALQASPIDRLLLETDSPYLAPVPHRGKPANPAMVLYQYELAARIKNLPLENLAWQVQSNFTKLMGLERAAIV